MKLAHFALNTPISWTGNRVCTLVLENNKFFRETILKLIEQAETGVGDFVLSENNEILPFEKNAEIITDVFSLDAALNKSVVTGLQKDVAQHAQFEMPEELADVFAKINGVLSKLSCESEFDVAFDDVNDIAALLKLYRCRPAFESLCLAEKLVLYMELLRKYAKKQLFIVINLKTCLSDDELTCLFKDVLYRKLNLLCIENCDRITNKFENKIILDDDMCEI